MNTRMYFCQPGDGTETSHTGIGKNEDALAFRQFTIVAGKYVGGWCCGRKAGKMMHHFAAAARDKSRAMIMSLGSHQSGLAERRKLFIVQVFQPIVVAARHFDEGSFRASGELEHEMCHA